MKWSPLLAMAGGFWGVVLGAWAAILGAHGWFVALMVSIGLLALCTGIVAPKRSSSWVAVALSRYWGVAGALYLLCGVLSLFSIGLFIFPAAVLLFAAALATAMASDGGHGRREEPVEQWWKWV